MAITARLRTILVALAVLLAVAGAAATGAAAAPPVADGTFTYTSSAFTNVRMVGPDTFIELTATVAYTGTFSGTSTVRGNLIIHADGSANFYDIETFTGTVNGVSGIVTFYLAGSGPAGEYQATAIVVHGTGALANLRGELHQVGVVPDKEKGPFGTYTGKIHTRGGGRDD